MNFTIFNRFVGIKKKPFYLISLGILSLVFISVQAQSQDTNVGANSQIIDLSERIKLWESEAFWCEGTPAKKDCDDGDMTLFNGLLCSNGIEVGCKGVGESQDLDGRWWRSPRRKENLNFGERNSFSRDMSLGVLLYLVKSRNHFAAEDWLNWIEQNRPCTLKKPFGGCWIRGPERFCRDGSQGICTISPNNWHDMYLVWNYLGLKPSKRMMNFAKRNAKVSKTELERTKEGYQLHLKAVSIWLHQLMNKQDGLDAELLDIILEKEPQNPFFRFLKEGATEAVLNKTLFLCPSKKIEDNLGNQWSWERSFDESAWRNSMYWDCLFMAKNFTPILEIGLDY